jgi:hypothetical protein
MSDPTMLAGDLREYFAATTSTAMPRRVAEMRAGTLPYRRGRLREWLAAGTGALAAAVLVFLVATHIPQGGSGAALSTIGAALRPGPGYGAPDAAVTYPGVDTAALADRGVRLLAPAGHGTASLTAAQAQAAARAAAGTAAGLAGPAVLVFAGVSDRGPAFTCLCWAVDVPTATGNQGPGPLGQHSQLVLVDALSGRVDAVVTGPGVP